MTPDVAGARVEKLEEENGRLRRAVEELSVLNELAAAIGALISSEEVIRKIISRSLRAVGAEQGVITLIDDQPDLPMKTLVRSQVSSSDHGQFHFNQALLGWIILNRKPLIVNHPGSDERFRGVTWDSSIHSVLCVPMLTRSALKGVLTVYNKKGENGFTDDDQRLLAIIAQQSAQVVENARLYEEERALLRVQEEYRVASQIQLDLLPKGPPKLQGYDVAGATFPARTIGGDYYDFIQLDNGNCAVCLGDVSGKGLPAALLMANLQASLRSHSNVGTSVSECIVKSNKHLFQSTGAEKFATLFYGVLDVNNHTLSYCNAGHEPPFLISADREPVRLKEGGTMIGIMENFLFQEASVEFKPGDTLVAYSDGVSEAMSNDKEQFGEDRLTELLVNNFSANAHDLIDTMIKAVRAHAGKAPQFDDITMLIIRRLPV